MAKLTQKQLAKLRADFMLKREELLKNKVSVLQRKLFDMVFDQYLTALETSDGKLTRDGHNMSLVNGLDQIYKLFLNTQNSQVVAGFIKDMDGIHSLNEKYFKNIAQKEIRTSAEKAQQAMNKSLGLNPDGSIKQNGFTDKFLRDESVNKQIKKLTSRAITNGTGFQEFRIQLKEFIEGNPKISDSGALHQYYRNYAYDTYQKIDQINGNAFAKEIGLRYFIYNGGIIKTSRAFCIHYNGEIVDSIAFSQLKKEDLPTLQQAGIPDDWTPLIDLGGYGCRHRKDWITDDIALRNRQAFSEKAAERRAKLK